MALVSAKTEHQGFAAEWRTRRTLCPTLLPSLAPACCFPPRTLPFVAVLCSWVLLPVICHRCCQTERKIMWKNMEASLNVTLAELGDGPDNAKA